MSLSKYLNLFIFYYDTRKVIKVSLSNGVDDKKISIYSIDVYCATDNVNECQKWGRTLSSAVRALSNIIGRDLKVLVVVTSGM